MRITTDPQLDGPPRAAAAMFQFDGIAKWVHFLMRQELTELAQHSVLAAALSWRPDCLPAEEATEKETK